MEKYKSSDDGKVRVGVAKDAAFCFYYKENLELLEESGAELVFFSPLRDQKIPENISGLIFGGGYPELNCKELSENNSMSVGKRCDQKRNALSGRVRRFYVSS